MPVFMAGDRRHQTRLMVAAKNCAGGDDESSAGLNSGSNNNNNNDQTTSSSVLYQSGGGSNSRANRGHQTLTLSTPTSASHLNSLLIQNFQQQQQQQPNNSTTTRRQSRAAFTNNNSNNNNMASNGGTVVLPPPTTAHPLVHSLNRAPSDKLATTISNGAMTRARKSSMSNNRQQSSKSHNSTQSEDSMSSDDDGTDGLDQRQLMSIVSPSSQAGMRPAAAHPKRRQSAAANHGDLTGSDEIDANGGEFSAVEHIQPSASNSHHQVSIIGLLNNSSNNKTGRQNGTEPPTTGRSVISIPNWTSGDDGDIVVEETPESVKRVERWLDGASASMNRTSKYVASYQQKQASAAVATASSLQREASKPNGFKKA